MGRDECLTAARTAVGAAPGTDLETGLASAVLRYAVHVRGSVPRASLLSEAVSLLTPIASEGTALPEVVEGELEALLAIGEVMLRQPAPGARIHVEPGRPAFVEVDGEGGRQLLVLGGSVDGRPTLPAPLESRLRPRGRARWLPLRAGEEGLKEELVFHGLREVAFDAWSRTPRIETTDSLVAPLLERSRRIAADKVASLEVFDPTTGNTYFRGRVRQLRAEDVEALCSRFGFAPARDPDADRGAHYSVIFHNGGAFSSLSLGFGVEARDRWLRLSAAVCHRHGADRAFRCERAGDILRLFFPPPSWLERLLSLGVPAKAGGLCAFSLPSAAWPLVQRALTDVAFADLRQA
jgi:hypothetical protein